MGYGKTGQAITPTLLKMRRNYEVRECKGGLASMLPDSDAAASTSQNVRYHLSLKPEILTIYSYHSRPKGANADIPFSVMNTRKTCQPQPRLRTLSSKSGWALRAEDLLVADLGDTVGERESEFLGDELLDVGALDVLGLLELDNLEDL